MEHRPFGFSFLKATTINVAADSCASRHPDFRSVFRTDTCCGWRGSCPRRRQTGSRGGCSVSRLRVALSVGVGVAAVCCFTGSADHSTPDHQIPILTKPRNFLLNSITAINIVIPTERSFSKLPFIVIRGFGIRGDYVRCSRFFWTHSYSDSAELHRLSFAAFSSGTFLSGSWRCSIRPILSQINFFRLQT